MEQDSLKSGTFFCAIIILTAVFIAPVAAGTTITIDNSTTIAAALINVGDGGTIILQPGTYFEYDLPLNGSVTVKANTSSGHGTGDTFIDGSNSGRIFEIDSYSLTIDSLSLRNGRSSGDGGAIHSSSPGSSLTVTNSEFYNFRSSGYSDGGAISSTGSITITGSTFTSGTSTGAANGAAIYSSGSLSVTDSTFTGYEASEKGGAIYTSSMSSRTFTNTTFTDCESLDNGFGDNKGGAIYSRGSGSLTITDSTFTSCKASKSSSTGSTISNGGAIYSDSGSITITGSTFTDCFAIDTYSSGGAINSTGILTVTDSTFTRCKAYSDGYYYGAIKGGAINIIGTLSVTGSTFNSCNASEKGGAIHTEDSDITITDSTFGTCIAASGGVIYSRDSNLTVTGSSFDSCNVSDEGGAIWNSGNETTVRSSTFVNCTAEREGGAIYSNSATLVITNSTFDNCVVVRDGGAILNYNCEATVTSSTFVNCSAGRDGGAVYSDVGNTTVHYSRIYDSNTGIAFVKKDGTFDATNNWWGTNSNPSFAYTSGVVTVDPWLILGGTASSPITLSQTSVVRGNLIYNSNGIDTSGSGFVPNGILVAFAMSNGSGSVSPATGTTTNGAGTTTFTPSTTGNSTINVTVDDATVNVTIIVHPASSGSDSSFGSGGGSNTDTGTGFAENLNAGENISFEMNKGAVYLVSFTAETGIKKLMITVRKTGSVPSSIGAPDTEVYEYEDVNLYYTENSDLSGKTFWFKVKKSWLAENGYSYDNIVMLHYNEGTGVWEELPTTLTGEDGTYYYYSAETPSFSWFAIAIEDGATIFSESTAASATKTAKAAATSSSSSTGGSVFTGGDTGIPAASGDQESWSFLTIPLLIVVLVIIVAVVIVVRKRKEKYPDWWDKELK